MLRSKYTNKSFKKLLYKKKILPGKSNRGLRINLNSGKKFLKTRNFSINYNLRYLWVGSIIGFRLIPFQNKLVSLIFFANGSFSFYLTTLNCDLFQFWIRTTKVKLKRFKIFKIPFLFNILHRIKKLSFVSCIELLPGKFGQYARSSGTKAKIFKIDKATHTVMLHLPSKSYKMFSYHSFALYGQLALADKKRINNTKAGYWRLFGIKPHVRGVAMNAVDHPHGGRTKTIKTPLTPWGFPTKRK